MAGEEFMVVKLGHLHLETTAIYGYPHLKAVKIELKPLAILLKLSLKLPIRR
jgi:hypothetical protein